MNRLIPFFLKSLVLVLLFGGLTFASLAKEMNRCLGKKGAAHSFVYLHGLDPSYGSNEEWTNRKILKQLADKYDVRIALPRSKNRCNGKFCWVYGTPRTMQASIDHVYQESKACGIDAKKAWIIGFSNGGYFLNRLFQNCRLQGNHISVAAPSSVLSGKSLASCGNLHVVAGKKEISYRGAKRLATKLKTLRKADTTFHGHSLYHHLPKFSEFELILKKIGALKSNTTEFQSR